MMLLDMQRAKWACWKSKIGRHNQDQSRCATNNRHILTWPVLTVATGLGFPTRPLWSAVTHQKVAVSAPLEPCLSSSVTACVCCLYQILLSNIYIYIYIYDMIWSFPPRCPSSNWKLIHPLVTTKFVVMTGCIRLTKCSFQSGSTSICFKMASL